MGAASIPPRPLVGTCGHRWMSGASENSTIPCPDCGRATRVKGAAARGAGTLAADPAARRRAPATEREKTPPPASRFSGFGAAPRPAALTPDPTPGGSRAAVDDDDQDEDDDPPYSDDDDEDDDDSADLDDAPSLAAALAELRRAFMPSALRPKQPQAAPVRPEAPPSFPEPFSGRLAGRMGTRGGNARPAPTVDTADASLRSDNRHFVRAFRALGFNIVPAKKRAPNSCPIQVDGRECPSFGRLVGISWPDIPDLRQPAAVCTSCAYNIRQRAISEADSQSAIPVIY